VFKLYLPEAKGGKGIKLREISKVKAELAQADTVSLAINLP
jgi:hypothetical protein